ncbi:MAG: ligase-associated DNA damage response endonuclease PdeM [Cyclobacteriaceae bacterium]|nr:ligase-associated DNA damage response endonuclease PdeM [Cyclobacteriaceae bacterium]MCH8514894.1 ligase-associated DNA damage response endonuclease PdeM [Cyclobacteriaceae bacterium]
MTDDQRYIELLWLEEKLWLLPEKAVFIPERSSLLLADLHLGKAGHFRKAGIPISSEIHHADIQRLDRLILEHSPKEVFFLGDLFHSDMNNEWELFSSFLNHHPTVNFHLIKGNHDLLPQVIYSSSRILVHQIYYQLGPFHLVHDPDDLFEGQDGFAGHIHPGTLLKGRGRDSIKLACFVKEPKLLVLPAFGEFTGLHCLPTESGRSFYPVTPQKVFDFAFNNH